MAGKWAALDAKGCTCVEFLEAWPHARCNHEAGQVRIIGMTCPYCVCTDQVRSAAQDGTPALKTLRTIPQPIQALGSGSAFRECFPWGE
jgi:hypothetical protein